MSLSPFNVNTTYTFTLGGASATTRGDATLCNLLMSHTGHPVAEIDQPDESGDLFVIFPTGIVNTVGAFRTGQSFTGQKLKDAYESQIENVNDDSGFFEFAFRIAEGGGCEAVSEFNLTFEAFAQ